MRKFILYPTYHQNLLETNILQNEMFFSACGDSFFMWSFGLAALALIFHLPMSFMFESQQHGRIMTEYGHNAGAY